MLALTRNLLRPPRANGAVTDLAGLLETALRTIRRRSLVVLISDFITTPGWERPLLQLSERHEIVAIRLVDRREYELPDAGRDRRRGRRDRGAADRRLQRRRVPARLRAAGEAREAELRSATLRAGVDIYEVSTEDDLVSVLVRIVEARKHRRRR